jgi:D-beta-D-heptose 7-phosphate kinase/D-beta-D-heptose 1-phosphate adenosyltransferase
LNPPRFDEITGRFREKRLLVAGDIMLDEFVWGRVSRVSPEAPVPVVEVTGESYFPGGAANVARNLRPFCDAVELAGVAGADAQGLRLRELLEGERIGTGGIVTGDGLATTVKTRIIARNQQVVRVDRERRENLPEGVASQAAGWLARAIAGVDAVILADYAKGFLCEQVVDAVKDAARRAGKPVTVDPNPGNTVEWRGVTAVKPNWSEALAFAGMPWRPIDNSLLAKVAGVLQNRWSTQALLITLGEHGMALYRPGHAAYHTPTRAREVFDVSGAGDTAIALFTLALAADADFREAAEIANCASSVVVGKFGTATLELAELREAFAGALR